MAQMFDMMRVSYFEKWEGFDDSCRWWNFGASVHFGLSLFIPALHMGIETWL